MSNQQTELETLASRWRASASPEDLVRAAARIPPGTDKARLRALLGEPISTSKLANGGESWLYVKSDPSRGQLESMFVALTPEGGFARLDRKPID